jgi:hypothetical protein
METTMDRNVIPDLATRERILVALIHAPALPLTDLSIYLDIPVSTLDLLRSQGRGPRTFKIGRRLYVRQVDLREWFDTLAQGESE